MQVIENKFLGEFYAIDKDRKFTLSHDKGVWSCNCYQADCEHVAAVKSWLKTNGGKKWGA